MAGINNVTGAKLQTKPNSKEFDENFDKIFGKKNKGNCEKCKKECNCAVSEKEQEPDKFK